MLRYDRHIGAFGGQSPILFVALDAYARRYGIEGVQFELFLRVLTILDDEYLRIVEENTPKPPKPGEKP